MSLNFWLLSSVNTAWWWAIIIASFPQKEHLISEHRARVWTFSFLIFFFCNQMTCKMKCSIFPKQQINWNNTKGNILSHFEVIFVYPWVFFFFFWFGSRRIKFVKLKNGRFCIKGVFFSFERNVLINGCWLKWVTRVVLVIDVVSSVTKMWNLKEKNCL